ncbi:hypothetical protein HFC70_10400 [Agrobacterium sp. a22-2]|uniref:hypothetical protein n=1 Tax=Agrobacterium sp. a22-2 TaxID=2283840 RepID=UPI001448920D|nr:hypothetical protein [Agrobacterium sp. a22-2]NKN36765.1 hypothetical protein [Agrobacterium sp. a22-2]
MAANNVSPESSTAQTKENIAYIRQMLGELRLVAQKEGAEMLCYLIEMAYVEAGDVQAGRRALSIQRSNGDKPTRVPV